MFEFACSSSAAAVHFFSFDALTCVFFRGEQNIFTSLVKGFIDNSFSVKYQVQAVDWTNLYRACDFPVHSSCPTKHDVEGSGVTQIIC